MSGANAPALAFFRYDLAADGRDGLCRIGERLRKCGVRLAGVVQRDVARAGMSRCEMQLEDLASGRTLSITADRGPHARGCRLDHAALAAAEMWLAEALRDGAEALIVNKFGKEESLGKGLFPTIAQACARGVPVLLGLSQMNREAAFRVVGEDIREFAAEAEALDWLKEQIRRGAALSG